MIPDLEPLKHWTVVHINRDIQSFDGTPLVVSHLTTPLDATSEVVLAMMGFESGEAIVFTGRISHHEIKTKTATK